MPVARLRLTIPPEMWLGDLSRAHPDTRIRVLAAIPDGLSGVGLAEIAGQGADSIVAAMEVEPELTSVEVLQASDDEALVQFETSNPLLLFPARGSGVPLELPFDIRDGEATWTVTAPSEQLSALGEQLTAFDIPYTVESVQPEPDRDALLTDRQRELVAAAVEAGYYDTPRECTLTELAATVGLAKSTCSQTLHRAEEAIIKAHVRRELDPHIQSSR